MPEKSELAVQEEYVDKPLVPVGNVTELVDAMRRFEQIKAALLVPDRDTYTVEGVERIRKSGWRKLALAFNISDEIVTENLVHDSTDPAYLCVHTRVKAWARGGRTVEGTGTASSRERKFAHLEHDLHALAHTRAKSRAIADMLGSSDLVAEEEPEVLVQPAPTPAPAPPSSSPARTSAPRTSRGGGAAVVSDFLDEVLGNELADLVTIECTGDEVLVKLDQVLCPAHGTAFIQRMMKWGYGIHESPAGLISKLKRPKG